jgi:hypothetical protein
VPSELGRVLQIQREQQRTWQRLFLAALDLNDDELRHNLKSHSAEERFVAAYVIGEKRLPWPEELIPVLTDEAGAARQAARRSLIILSFLALNPEEARLIASHVPYRKPKPLSQLKPPVDFGPTPTAKKDARALAAAKWREWWNKQARQETSVLHALAEGTRTPSVDHEAEKLASKLTTAQSPRQEGLLEQLRDSKGGKFTEALAMAIPRLDKDMRAKARDALAERMSRMSEKTLEQYLQDDSAEIRRASVLAVAMRDSFAHTDRVISLLLDPEPRVWRAAHAAMHSLSKEDFGPTLNATDEEREQAILRWESWWQEKR